MRGGWESDSSPRGVRSCSGRRSDANGFQDPSTRFNASNAARRIARHGVRSQRCRPGFRRDYADHRAPARVVALKLEAVALTRVPALVNLMSGVTAPMESPRFLFQSAEIIDRLRCIALSVSQRISVRLRHAERMAPQFDAAAFRLAGRGVF